MDYEDRTHLIERLATLCDYKLPDAAESDWPIYHDHCFRRVAYDNAVEAQWDDVVNRPFIEHANTGQLAVAVGIARTMHLGGQGTVAVLNQQSLEYRE